MVVSVSSERATISEDHVGTFEGNKTER